MLIYKNLQFLLLFLIFNSAFCNEKLDFYNEEELAKLFKEEKFVFVLLSETKECIEKCAVLEETLLSVREDLVEDTGGWVVRSYAPKFQNDFGIPSLSIFFMRDKRPLLYSKTPLDEDELVRYFLENKESKAHNLTDDNFEHDTQASTGATTGDWFVMFTRTNCEECLKMIHVFESATVKLKGSKNAAIVEREHGAVTARRFGVKTFPAFILFRLGHMYRYNLPQINDNLLASFAKETFRNSKKENIPQPKSPFDDVTEAAADWIKENPLYFLGSVASFLLFVLIVVLLNRPPPESWTKKKKKKKN